MSTNQIWAAPSNVARRSYTLSNLLRDSSRNVNNFSKVYVSSLSKTLRDIVIGNPPSLLKGNPLGFALQESELLQILLKQSYRSLNAVKVEAFSH